jgi:hypothetical protein
MKKEARLLLHKGIDSLILSVEHFNRPTETGRSDAVLIFLDHAFEMLLKAAILHRGGAIRERRAKQTIGFDECVRRALSNGDIQFLKKEQALTLQTINGLRDAAQHHLLDISEPHLYIHAQAGLTLFKDVYKGVFRRDLGDVLPARVLPISTTPPNDIATLFDTEVALIKTLLKPGSRRRTEAAAKLRPLAIVEAALGGERGQPSPKDVQKLATGILKGQSWDKLFPGVASINLTQKGYGPSLDLRITKKQGIPIHVVPEGTPGATVVAVRTVDKLGFYNLGLAALAKQLNLSTWRCLAYIDHMKLQADPECYTEISIGKSKHKRYSQKAIDRIRRSMEKMSPDEVWRRYRLTQKYKASM